MQGPGATFWSNVTSAPQRSPGLRRTSGGCLRGLGTATAVLVDFDVPLSRAMSVALFDLSQKLELPMTLGVPPLAQQNQASFGDDFLETSGRFFRIEPRPTEPK